MHDPREFSDAAMDQSFPGVAQPPVVWGAPPHAACQGHQLRRFSVFWLLVLNFITLGIFGTIWLNLMHGKLPRIRHDDPSAGAAIGLLFVPFFNFYWVFFTYARLMHRINEQRVQLGMRPAAPFGLAVTVCCVTLAACIPYVGILPGLLNGFLLVPLFISFTQCAVNSLADLSEMRQKSPADPAQIAIADGTAIAEFRRSWGGVFILMTVAALLGLGAIYAAPLTYASPGPGGYVDQNADALFVFWLVSVAITLALFAVAGLLFLTAAGVLKRAEELQTPNTAGFDTFGAEVRSSKAGRPLLPVALCGAVLGIGLAVGTLTFNNNVDQRRQSRIAENAEPRNETPPAANPKSPGIRPGVGNRPPLPRFPNRQPPKPVVPPPAPKPVVPSPAPKPVVPSPAPQPVVEPPAPQPVIALADGQEYLRDLSANEVSVLVNGQQTLLRDITVDKTVYTHSLYTCPPARRTPAEVKYSLAGRYIRLAGMVALHDYPFPLPRPLTFKILGDGELLWESAPVQRRNIAPTVAFDVDLTGVEELTLLVECPSFHSRAHAVWIDPKLSRDPSGSFPQPPPEPVPAVASADGKEFLRDLAASKVSVLVAGEHKLLRDITVGKTKYTKGLYTCPPAPRTPAEVGYALDGQYTRLTGMVALCDYVHRSWSALSFKVFGDGELLWESAPIQRRNIAPTAAFDVDLTDVQELKLVVECPGSHNFAHAVWIDPELTRRE